VCRILQRWWWRLAGSKRDSGFQIDLGHLHQARIHNQRARLANAYLFREQAGWIAGLDVGRADRVLTPLRAGHPLADNEPFSPGK
jgi:hypothetical protein